MWSIIDPFQCYSGGVRGELSISSSFVLLCYIRDSRYSLYDFDCLEQIQVYIKMCSTFVQPKLEMSGASRSKWVCFYRTRQIFDKFSPLSRVIFFSRVVLLN